MIEQHTYSVTRTHTHAHTHTHTDQFEKPAAEWSCHREACIAAIDKALAMHANVVADEEPLRILRRRVLALVPPSVV
jgi:hypothetical protein